MAWSGELMCGVVIWMPWDQCCAAQPEGGT